MSKFKNIVAAALSLPALTGLGAGLWAPAVHAQSEQGPAARELEVVVERGYQPSRLTLTAGEHVRLKFIRREHTPCTREIVFPALDIRKELPPNQPVLIELPALAPGEYEFRCGMNMIRGKLVVSPSP